MHRSMVLWAGLFMLLAFGTPVAAQVPCLPPNTLVEGGICSPPVVPPDHQRFGSIFVQCPGDTNGDSIPDGPVDPNVRCIHLTGGDGFVTMADGKPLYIFGFSDVTGVPPASVMDVGALSANFPAPTIRLKEGQNFYLNLTNVTMVMRPDLFDEHSVHFHGFPQCGAHLRRDAGELDCRQDGLHRDLLLQARRAGHLHVPLPRRGHRAHADGDARQPVRRAQAERHHDRRLFEISRTTMATARPGTTSSSRSRLADSIRSSTTRARPCSRCRSRSCGTGTRC